MTLKQVAAKLIKAYSGAYAPSDTDQVRFKLDLSTSHDSFLCVALGIMYAFPIQPRFAEDVIQYLFENTESKNGFSVAIMSKAYNRIRNENYRS